MHAGLKGEEISCCRVVQSQKAAVHSTEERHTAGERSELRQLDGRTVATQTPLNAMGSEHASRAGLTVIPIVEKNAAQTEGTAHRSLISHRPVSGIIPRETSHFANVGCAIAFSSRGPWAGTQRRRVSTFLLCTVLS